MNTPRYIHVIIIDKENEVKELMLASSYSSYSRTRRLVSNMVSHLYDAVTADNALEEIAKAAHTLSGAIVVDNIGEHTASFTIKINL